MFQEEQAVIDLSGKPHPTRAAAILLLLGLLLCLAPRTALAQPDGKSEPPIDPKTPAKDLLPAAPRVRPLASPFLGDDLSLAPEVEFEAAPARNPPGSGEGVKHIAQTIARINHLNARKMDGFIESLRSERADLAGLPMAMGDACRTRGERSRQFTMAASVLRADKLAEDVAGFWERYQSLCLKEDQAQAGADRPLREHITQARIAALMQVLAPTPTNMRLGLVKHLSAIAHVDATRAIAKLSIFSPEEEIRQAAVDALKVRREKDYTDVLLQGLRYPWPTVARRASEVLIKLERTDLVPQLLDVLEEGDPRLPVVKEVNKKETPVVRELVRINHHRNCLLCHAPGNTGAVSPESLTAPVSVPGLPLTPPEGYYGPNSNRDLLVRIDVTYLRQDFSMMQAVQEADPWPEMQRFDFLVRTRTLTEAEAKTYREKLAQSEPGQQSPYQQAVVNALRELTGKDAEPTPDAWRKLLGLGDKQTRK
jgi:hypothetical protein